MILYSPPDSLFIFLCPFFIFNGVAGHVPAVTPQRDPPAAPRGRAPTTRPGDPGSAGRHTAARSAPPGPAGAVALPCGPTSASHAPLLIPGPHFLI